MISQDLVHRRLLFDPDLDFEDLDHVPELPGKQVMADLLQVIAQKHEVCSKLIQDSHGWCFKILSADLRKYWIELVPVKTSNGMSEWVLGCSRCMGLRLWEIAKDSRKPLGSEQKCLDLAAEILISQHGFEK